jgi:hypothetical protein
LKQRGRDADSGTVFPVVIFILFVGGLVALFRYGGPLNRKATVAPKSITTKTAPLPATPALASTDAILYKVAEALGQTHRNIKDITGDGRINCQDYSAMFLRVVSASGLEAQIIYNPNIGLTGHVFNRVRTPDGWLYVEPQRTRNWLMRQAWPEWERVRHLNQEATNTYRR